MTANVITTEITGVQNIRNNLDTAINNDGIDIYVTRNTVVAIRSKDGGIVDILGGEFRNNLTGIHFEPYPFMNISNLLFAASGHMARFDSLWPALPSRFGLAGESLAEYDDLDEVFSLLRPYVLQDQLKSLTAGALDSLEAYAELCSEPGFLASNILRRNGVSVEPQCGEEEQQYLRQDDRQVAPGAPRIETGEGIRIYPNPAKGELIVEIPPHTEWATARIFNLHGSMALYRNLAGGVNSLHSALPSGLYIIEIEMPGGERLRRKIILSR